MDPKASYIGPKHKKNFTGSNNNALTAAKQPRGGY
jgi:hypothetical protein